MGRAHALAVVLLTSVWLPGCGGSSNSPTPVTQPPSPVPPSSGSSVNLAPVIESVAISAERMEIDSELTLTASVKDEETAVDQLKFDWTAEAGTFSGEGASVKWRPPAGAKTPADYSIKLSVTEAYGTPDSSGARRMNVSTATSPSVRVHNSPKELGEMSIRFLSDFATSQVPAGTCLRDFTDSCKGKAEERSDIEANRAHFDIIDSSLTLRFVNANLGAGSANMTVACSFTSKIKACDPGDKSCVVGDVGTARGDCVLTGKYEDKRWWLCDSHFNGRLLGAMRSFFGRP